MAVQGSASAANEDQSRHCVIASICMRCTRVANVLGESCSRIKSRPAHWPPASRSRRDGSLQSVAVYAHAATSEEVRKADLLPVPKAKNGR
jgi:hypothetical protein